MSTIAIAVGDRIGKWLVLAVSEPRVVPTHVNAKRHSHVSVRCDCGYEREMILSLLAGGGTQSCLRCARSRAQVMKHDRRSQIDEARRRAREERNAVAAKNAEAVPVPPAEVALLAFDVGDEVRARGVRGPVLRSRPDAVQIRGVAGWIPVEEVEEA